MHTLTHIAATLVAGLALAAVAPPALADGVAGGQHPVVLQYQVADLATPGALEHTYLRMSRAAQQVCEPYAGRELARQRVFQRCVDATLSAAVAAVRDPRLTALHDSRAPPQKVAATPVRTARR